MVQKMSKNIFYDETEKRSRKEDQDIWFGKDSKKKKKRWNEWLN